MQQTFLVVLIFFAALINAQCESVKLDNCEYTTPAGDTVDFSKLAYDPCSAIPTSPVYIGTDSKSNTFYINFCDMVSQITAPDCNKAAPEGSCQSSAGNYFGAGSVASASFAALDPTVAAVYPNITGGSITYTGGDSCANSLRSTSINVVCTSGTEGISGSVATSTTDNCAYIVTFLSEAPCGGGGGGGGVNPGWVIIFLLSILFILYVIAGAIVKAVKYEARDINIIPNFDFWVDVPFLFKDGCAFFLNKISCGKVCGGYSQI